MDLELLSGLAKDVHVSARYASVAKLDIPDVARQVIREVGYPKDVFDADNCSIMTSFADRTSSEYEPLARLRKDLIEHVIEPVCEEARYKPDAKTSIFINLEGPLIGGGPSYRSGLTGRKTGVDTYGEYARH